MRTRSWNGKITHVTFFPPCPIYCLTCSSRRQRTRGTNKWEGFDEGNGRKECERAVINSSGKEGSGGGGGELPYVQRPKLNELLSISCSFYPSVAFVKLCHYTRSFSNNLYPFFLPLICIETILYFSRFPLLFFPVSIMALKPADLKRKKRVRRVVGQLGFLKRMMRRGAGAGTESRSNQAFYKTRLTGSESSCTGMMS